ncbi:hypothetical protein BVI2075_400020 [Burkholderia vietnamiensis]|nr:hypothetical protein BVI2075_400020 [Burkholderia vietnamiensis]
MGKMRLLPMQFFAGDNNGRVGSDESGWWCAWWACGTGGMIVCVVLMMTAVPGTLGNGREDGGRRERKAET